jgi:hypothetical protein
MAGDGVNGHVAGSLQTPPFDVDVVALARLQMHGVAVHVAGRHQPLQQGLHGDHQRPRESALCWCRPRSMRRVVRRSEMMSWCGENAS